MVFPVQTIADRLGDWPPPTHTLAIPPAHAAGPSCTVDVLGNVRRERSHVVFAWWDRARLRSHTAKERSFRHSVVGRSFEVEIWKANHLRMSSICQRSYVSEQVILVRRRHERVEKNNVGDLKVDDGGMAMKIGGSLAFRNAPV